MKRTYEVNVTTTNLEAIEIIPNIKWLSRGTTKALSAKAAIYNLCPELPPRWLMNRLNKFTKTPDGVRSVLYRVRPSRLLPRRVYYSVTWKETYG